MSGRTINRSGVERGLIATKQLLYQIKSEFLQFISGVGLGVIDEMLTRESIDAEGWMHSGDLAVMDADGYINITGRIKDMIIRGGENIYPREIEEFLFRNDRIQDVQVFGVPDKRYGEEICAWVLLKSGESTTADDIKDFCKDQIAHFKVPRYIRFVDQFPMTVTGKIQKFVMRDRMVEELKLELVKTA